MNIFISYTRDDRDIVDKLEKIIKNNKDDVIPYSIWRDVEVLKSGDTFNDEIYRGILNCDIFVPFISKYSINASGVIKEIHSALFHNYVIKDKSPHYIKPVLIIDDEIRELDSLAKKYQGNELVKQLVDDIKRIQYSSIAYDNSDSDLKNFYDDLKGSLHRNNLWKINGYCKFDENNDKSLTLTYKSGYPSIVSYFLKDKESIKEIKATICFRENKNRKTRAGISLRRHNGNPNDELFRFHIDQNNRGNIRGVYYNLDRGEVNCISDLSKRPDVEKSDKYSLYIKPEEGNIYCYINDKIIFLHYKDELYFNPEDIKEVQFMAWADGNDFEVEFSDCYVTIG